MFQNKKLLSGNYSDSSFVVCLFSFRTTTFKRCMKILSAKGEILLMCVGLLKTSGWMAIPSTWAKHLMLTCVYPVCQLVTSSKLHQPRWIFTNTIYLGNISVNIGIYFTEILRRLWNAKRQIHYLPNCNIAISRKILYYKNNANTTFFCWIVQI